LFVAELCTRAAAARVDKDVEMLDVIPRDIREHTHPFRAPARARDLTDEEDLNVVWIEKPPGGQHFPGTNEIEFLRAVEDGYPDPCFGSVPHCDELSPTRVRRRPLSRVNGGAIPAVA
jgi:hypothetical protein